VGGVKLDPCPSPDAFRFSAFAHLDLLTPIPEVPDMPSTVRGGAASSIVKAGEMSGLRKHAKVSRTPLSENQSFANVVTPSAGVPDVVAKSSFLTASAVKGINKMDALETIRGASGSNVLFADIGGTPVSGASGDESAFAGAVE
jgi:hypothetical protein